jgi:DNA-binding IclR family transcriptional regulator
MVETHNDPRLIGSVVKAVNILKCFEDKSELGVSEITAMLGLHKSTVFSLISTLEHVNLLEKSNDTRKYRPGIELFRLGSMVSLDVRHLARFELESLQETLRETVHLARRSDLSVIFLERFESIQTIKIYTVDAKPLPIYATASGKAILSTLDETTLSMVIDRIEFKPYTDHTIRSADGLRTELARIRADGYAIDDEEYEDGLFCVGAPLYDWQGRSDYAISVSGPKVRTNGAKFNDIRRLVMETAALVSKKLGSNNIKPA